MGNAKRAKIVMIGPAYPYRGGNALFMTYLYEFLKQHYDIVFFNFKVLYPKLLFPGKTQFDSSQQVIPQIPARRIVHAYNPLNWPKVAKAIIREQPDLLLFDWWNPFLGLCYWGVSLLLPEYLRSRMYIIAENVISHEARAIDAFLTRIGFRFAKGFIALSRVVEQMLQDFRKDRPVYRAELPIFNLYRSMAPNQLTKEQARANLNLPLDGEILLFFGYVRKYKGLDLLIQAFAKVAKRRPKMYLVVAGEFYDDVQKYTKLIQELQLSDRILITNRYIPNEQVADYYTAADVVVLPYREATQSAVLTIAYSFEKPVIATEVGGLKEYVYDRKTGILVPPEDVNALSRAIEEYFETRHQRDYSSHIQELLLQNRFESFLQIIQQILSNENEKENW